MECYTYLRNVTDLLSDGKTPYEKRFGQPFKGPIIPFGSLVEYHPITAKDQSRIHQFGKKVLPGLFLGYALHAGGIWKGDVLIADLEELETMDASEIYSKRLNAKEVIFPKEKGEFIFPIADGRIKPLGGDQDLRTSTLVRHHPSRGEHQKSCHMNQPKSQNQIKMRITNWYVETRIPTYQSGCKNSERILWMKEFLNRDSHTSSSHEPSLEPTRSVDLGKHSV